MFNFSLSFTSQANQKPKSCLSLPHNSFPVLLIICHVQLFVTLCTVARQAPMSKGLSKQEYWSGLPFPSLGNLPNPGIKPVSPAWQIHSLPLSHLGSPWVHTHAYIIKFPNFLQLAHYFVSRKKKSLKGGEYIAYLFLKI